MICREQFHTISQVSEQAEEKLNGELLLLVSFFGMYSEKHDGRYHHLTAVPTKFATKHRKKIFGSDTLPSVHWNSRACHNLHWVLACWLFNWSVLWWFLQFFLFVGFSCVFLLFLGLGFFCFVNKECLVKCSSTNQNHGVCIPEWNEHEQGVQWLCCLCIWYLMLCKNEGLQWCSWSLKNFGLQSKVIRGLDKPMLESRNQETVLGSSRQG